MIDTIGRYLPEFNNLKIRKDCPFCGCADVEIVSSADIPLFFLACKTCNAAGPSKNTINDAITAWNRRKTNG